MGDGAPRGVAKYEAAVAVCRRFGVVTPEDPYVVWPEEPRCVIAPLFLLYDYSFRPDPVTADDAVAWAEAAGILSADERFLAPDPYPTREAWCRVRVEQAAPRLAEAALRHPLVLVNHFPLRSDLGAAPKDSPVLPVVRDAPHRDVAHEVPGEGGRGRASAHPHD